MEKLEAGKCYALLISKGISEVVKVFPSDNKRFDKFFKTESISLRHYEFGIMQVAYLHKDVTRDCIEIPEEEYQKFYHLWEVYCKSLEIAKLKLEKELKVSI